MTGPTQQRTSQRWFFLTSSPHNLRMQEAGGALAELAACSTSLRELSIWGEAQGPDVMAAVAGAYGVPTRRAVLLHAWVADRCSSMLFAVWKGCLMVSAAGFVNLTSLRLRAGWYFNVPMCGFVYGGHSRHCCLWSLQHLTAAASGGTRCQVARTHCFRAAMPHVLAGPTLRAPP